jgi:hypothetical protein
MKGAGRHKYFPEGTLLRVALVKKGESAFCFHRATSVKHIGIAGAVVQFPYFRPIAARDMQFLVDGVNQLLTVRGPSGSHVVGNQVAQTPGRLATQQRLAPKLGSESPTCAATVSSQQQFAARRQVNQVGRHREGNRDRLASFGGDLVHLVAIEAGFENQPGAIGKQRQILGKVIVGDLGRSGNPGERKRPREPEGRGSESGEGRGCRTNCMGPADFAAADRPAPRNWAFLK